MQQEASSQLESRLDNQEYDESELIEVRVTLNMPYQQRFTEFERHYGEIEVAGKTYTFVQQKIEGDVAIFKCIPNKSGQAIKNVNNQLDRANNGHLTDQPGKQQVPSVSKVQFSDFDDQQSFLSLNAQPLNLSVSYESYSSSLPSLSVNAPEQPPKC